MALNATKSGFQGLLSALLSTANQDANMWIPPIIVTAMVNTITAFLIDKCVALYPDNPQLIDIIYPFVKVCAIPPCGGNIVLPTDYRNLLGSPSVIVKNDKGGECDQQVPISNANQFLKAILKGGCTRRPIKIVAQSEFDYLTTSTYKRPTYWDPIGFNAGVDEKGQKLIRICPTDLARVYLLYVKQENTYNMVYVQNPDETYYIDPVNTIDTEWGAAAFSNLVKGLSHLYGIYSRDKQFSDWAMALSQISIV